MIVKRRFSPLKVLGYVWAPLTYAVAVATAVVLLDAATGSDWLVVPFAPVGTLGGALAIFVAIRNNASYARWWEARTVWGGVSSTCRALSRQLIAATDSAIAGGADREATLAFRRELVLRLVAVAVALEVELRGTGAWSRLARFIPEDELPLVIRADGKANTLLLRQAIRIKDGVRAGMIGQFDPISLEPNLVALNAAAASCERLKHTPTPRQYDYFTRLAVTAFSTVLPLGLLGAVAPGHEAWVVGLSALIAGVFIVLERVGAVLDAPFENRTTDIPLTAITIEIERDLRELLGDDDRPAPAVAVDGYLW